MAVIYFFYSNHMYYDDDNSEAISFLASIPNWVLFSIIFFLIALIIWMIIDNFLEYKKEQKQNKVKK